MKRFFLLCFALFLFNVAIVAQWTLLNNGFQYGHISGIVESNSILFIGTDNGVFRSSDHGFTWTSFNSGLFNMYIDDIVIKGNSVFIATEDGVFISSISSANWIKTAMQNKTRNLTTDLNYILSFDDQKDLYKSTDDGASWAKVNFAVIPTYGIWDMVASNSKIFIGTQVNGLWYSIDNGNNWNKATLNEGQISALLIDNNIIYAGSQNGVYTSFDNGANWQTSDLSNKTIWSFAKYNKNIFAGSYSGGIYKSENNGTNWVQINDGLTNVNNESFGSIVTSSNYIFIGTSSGKIYRRNIADIVSVPQIDKLPNTFLLSQNYPNPFNPSTTINFSIPNLLFITLKVYDMLGREVVILVNGEKPTGNYEVKFDGSNLPSGVYFYRLSAGEFSETKKLMLLK